MRDIPQVGLRRSPPAPPPPDADPELVARIRDEIANRGPITVARFMERALYEPGLGYYRRATGGPGTAAADFLTAPEAHPVFGAALGLLAEHLWGRLGRPDPFVVQEQGAGTGSLAIGLLDGLRRRGSPLLEAVAYRLVDRDDARVEVARARLEDAGLGRHVAGRDAGRPAPGMVIANEVADALPVHRVVQRGLALRERLVTTDGDGFVEVDGPLSDPRLATRLAAEGIVLDDGQVGEICLALDGWLAAATEHLADGLAIVLDYGEEAPRLYRPERRDGTLRAFQGHRVSGDVYRGVGRHDITAHVDLTALRAAAVAAGLEPVGSTTQAEFLVAIDTGSIVADLLAAPDTDLAAALALRSALARLLDPQGLGGFAMEAFGRGVAPPLPGFDRLRGQAGATRR